MALLHPELTYAKSRGSYSNSEEPLKKGSLVALVALGLLSLTIIGSVFFIHYLSTHTFTDLTDSAKKTPVQASAAKVDEVAKSTFVDLTDSAKKPSGKSFAERVNKLTENKLEILDLDIVSEYFNLTYGKKLNGKETIQDQRLRKNNSPLPFSVTPIPNDKNVIFEYLIHGEKIGSKSSFSRVRKGILIKPLNDDSFAVKEVCMHRTLKREQPVEEMSYASDIKTFQELFKDAKHSNVEGSPLAYGWLNDHREFTVTELSLGDACHIAAKSSEQLLQFVSDIASGLNFYHDHDVVHRDLKPDNVLISKAGRAILIDPMPIKEETLSGPSGSPGFIPPEVWYPFIKREKSVNSRASDMFAAGASFLDLKTKYLLNCIEKLNVSEETKRLLTLSVNEKMRSTAGIIGEAGGINPSTVNNKQINDIAGAMRARILPKKAQNGILDTIKKHGGFEGEDVALVNKRLAKLDQISEKLLAQDKAKRPTARDVLEFVKDESIA